MRFFRTLPLGLFALDPGHAALAQPTKQQRHLQDSTLTQLHQQALFNDEVLVADLGRVVYQKSPGSGSGRVLRIGS